MRNFLLVCLLLFSSLVYAQEVQDSTTYSIDQLWQDLNLELSNIELNNENLQKLFEEYSLKIERLLKESEEQKKIYSERLERLLKEQQDRLQKLERSRNFFMITTITEILIIFLLVTF